MEGRRFDDQRTAVNLRAMSLKRGVGYAATAAAVMAMLVVGCGGSGGDSSSATTSSSNETESSESSKSSDGSNSEPSAEFAGEGPNAELVTFGKESDVAEREAASEVLEENLEARAAGDWEAQCLTLAEPIVKGIERSAGGTGAGCAKSLEVQASSAPESILANPMTEPIAALRVGGIRGFALFHGANGKDYVMPLLKEGSEWKVASLTTEEVP
jgi:hypothetical protein